jgi:hypothetical protein
MSGTLVCALDWCAAVRRAKGEPPEVHWGLSSGVLELERLPVFHMARKLAVTRKQQSDLKSSGRAGTRNSAVSGFLVGCIDVPEHGSGRAL